MPLYPSIFFFFKFLYQILFSYICYQIIRLVGLFGIGEPERKVEFQTEMFLYVFFRSIFRQPDSFWTLLYIKNTDRTVFLCGKSINILLQKQRERQIMHLVGRRVSTKCIIHFSL